MIFGEGVDLKFPDICLTGEEKPRKTSPRKPVPTEDLIRARCVTGAHAIACSTLVDYITVKTVIIIVLFVITKFCQMFSKRYVLGFTDKTYLVTFLTRAPIYFLAIFYSFTCIFSTGNIH